MKYHLRHVTFFTFRRFETVFYLVGVNNQPDIQVTNDEVQQSLVFIDKKVENLSSKVIFNLFSVANTKRIA